MRVHDLARHGLASANVACDASILRIRGDVWKMLRTIPVAGDAEACTLDSAQTEAVVVVVTRCTQTTAQLG